MSDSYNFNKNLKVIVAQDLEHIGFKRENTKFIRVKDNFIEKVFFQRSRWNIPNYPFEFFLNLYLCTSEDRTIDEIRLQRPTDISMPDYYKIYTLDLIDGKDVDFDQFTKEQKECIGNYMVNRMWKYSSEEELINLFYEAKELLITKVNIYFDNIKKLIDENNAKKVIDFKITLNGL